MSASTIDETVFEAKLAEQTERYDEMKDCMKKVVLEKKTLEKEERNLLSVAYKNVVGSRRASWRVLNSIEEQTGEGMVAKVALVTKYREKIEEELEDICGDVLKLLDETLVLQPKIGDEAQVFYYKMKGDYLRYLAEVQSGEKQTESAQTAKKAYEAAETAAQALAATNPIRLGLALNFSVFYYEILRVPEKACGLAKGAFDAAVIGLDSLDGAQYKDATLIMQLLRDNLSLWQAESDEGQHTAGQVDADGTEVQDM